MPSTAHHGGPEKTARLISKLRALDFWDDAYWRNPHPEWYEISAFSARQQRRTEILFQLQNITQLRDSENGLMSPQERECHVTNERRCSRRFEFDSEVTIFSAIGLVPGRTLEINKHGMSAILPVELEVGDIHELKIKLPIALATTRAVVRSRSVFRHGFEFLQPLHDVVVHDVAPDACQTCSGNTFILQLSNQGQGLAFARIRCPSCDGTGWSRKHC